MPKLLLLNARSLKKSLALSALHADLISNNIEISVITETWFDDTISIDFSYIKSYQCFRSDRSRNNSYKSTGGGVCVYVSSQINATQIYPPDSERYEVIWIRMNYHSKDILLCGLYAPPDINSDSRSSIINHFSYTIIDAVSNNPHLVVILAGDLNSINGNDVVSRTPLTQLNSFFTRKNKLLDYIFCSHPNYFKDVLAFNPPFHTDHIGVLCIPSERPKNFARVIYYRDLRAQNKLHLHHLLSNIDLSIVYSLTDIDDAVQYLESTLLSCLDSACPWKKCKIKSRDPVYMSPLLKLLIQRKNKRGISAAERTTIVERIKYVILENIANRRVSRGTKQWWDKINSLSGRKKDIMNLGLDCNDVNRHFANICNTSNYRSFPACQLITHRCPS